MWRLGWAAVAGIVLQGVLGGVTVIFLSPKAVSILHACLAQLFFAVTASIAMFTCPCWYERTQIVDDPSSPSLRRMALLVAAAILAQTALGAAFRHQAVSVIPHVVGATLTAILVLHTGISILTQYAGHKPLRGACWMLLSATVAQLALGVAAYVSRVSTADAPQPMPSMVFFTVTHVTVGAIAMAGAVLLAIQVFRHVRPLEASASEGLAVAR